MKIGMAQINCVVDDVEANTEKALDYCVKASDQGCSVVALPEIADLGYVLSKVAVSAFTLEDNPYLDALKGAAQTHSITVLSGLAERDQDGNVYNTVVAIEPSGKIVAKYRKTHLVTIEPICEQNHLSQGNEIEVHEIAGVTSGIMTCYDLRFPEIARAMTLKGAKVIYLISAFPTLRAEHWQVLIQARAIENQVFVSATNCVGSNGPKLHFCGQSRTFDPYGTALNETSADKESLFVADIDLPKIDEVRSYIGALKDRRPELYETIAKS